MKDIKLNEILRADPEKRMIQLTVAIKNGDVGLVKLLVGLDTALSQLLNAIDSNGQAPLHNAARFDQAETIVILIDLGAKINIRNITNDTPLHVASRFGSVNTVALLLQFGANISARGALNMTPLHAAAAEGQVETIRLLIKIGANPFLKTSLDIDYGNTALHLAAFFGQTAAIEVLLSPEVWPDDIDVVKKLRDKRNMEHNTPLHLAVSNGHVEAVRCLIEKGADINAKGKYDRRPIHIAAIKGHAQVVRLLLEHGAAITARSGPEKPDFRQTPIHLAAFHGHIDVIDALLEKERRLINLRSHVQGQTPLHRAIANFQADCVEALIKRGAIVNVGDDMGRTPLKIIQTSQLELATFRQAENRLRILKLLEDNCAKLLVPLRKQQGTGKKKDVPDIENGLMSPRLVLPKISLVHSNSVP